ncbi:hypothetical protein CTI14_03295 [Methylobacterium radiotolerans]|nr:hypothetical protein CTI14_03295 [Methylobacterium radiotolerans]
MLRLLSAHNETPGLLDEEAFFQELLLLEAVAALENAPDCTLNVIKRLRLLAGRAALAAPPHAAIGVRGH